MRGPADLAKRLFWVTKRQRQATALDPAFRELPQGVNRFRPSRSGSGFRLAVGVAPWIGASVLFRVYLHFFNSYSRTYGSLGAVIVQLLWLYISGLAVLMGGKINSEIETPPPGAAILKAGEPGKR